MTKKNLNLLFVTLICGGTLILLYSFLWGWGKEKKGNGNIISKTMDVKEFKNVIVQGSFDVELTQSDFSKVVVETDENLFEYIKVTTQGSQLTLSQSKIYRLVPTEKIKVRINSRLYKSINLAGSGEVSTTNSLESNDVININVAGSGDAKVSVASCASSKCTVSGSGSLDYDGKAEKIDAYVTGSGNANLDVNSGDVSFHVSGSGTIVGKGKADNLSINVTGSGDVKGKNIVANKVDATIVGSGNVYVHSDNQLDVKIVGSGDLIYTGDPQFVNTKITGSGKVKHKQEKHTVL